MQMKGKMVFATNMQEHKQQEHSSNIRNKTKRSQKQRPLNIPLKYYRDEEH